MINGRKLSFAPFRDNWKKFSKYADINHHKSLNRSDSIGLIRRIYDKIPVKNRDFRINEALEEIESAAPSRQFFIEYLVTLCRMGFAGSAVAQEIMCSTIRCISHAKRFSVRTLRDCATWAIEHGFIMADWQPIGSRINTAGGNWKTKQVRRYSMTYRVRLLVSVLKQKRHSPTLFDAKDLHLPTPANSADNPKGELSELRDPEDLSSDKLLRLCKKDDLQELAQSNRLPEKEESAKADFKSASPQNKPSRMASPFSHRNRIDEPRTYRASRAQLLHDLWIYLKPGTPTANPNAENQYFIAETQTDTFYPQFLPSIIDWNKISYDLYTESWHSRRKFINKTLAPLLKTFSDAWIPPAFDKKDRFYQQKFDDWERSLCIEPGIAIPTADYENYYKYWPHVRAYLSACFAGRCSFDWLKIRDFHYCKLFTKRF